MLTGKNKEAKYVRRQQQQRKVEDEKTAIASLLRLAIEQFNSQTHIVSKLRMNKASTSAPVSY